VLVLEEEDRVVAADRGAQQAVGIEGRRGQTTRKPGFAVNSEAPVWLW
jgi:hypothetical protein